MRKKIIPFTPEEWVRQHCIELLIEYYQISESLIAIERQIQIHHRTKRFDIVAFNSNGNPSVLVECKAPQVALSPQTYTQAGNYLSIVDSEYVWLSNGLEHIWMRKSNQHYQIIEFPKSIKAI